MGCLLIRLFGGLSVELEGARLSSGMGRNVGGLLAYLALHRQRLHHRETVAEVFWPDVDPDLARRCLNTTLWRLRRLIEPHSVRRGTYLVSTAQGEIGLKNSDALWVDISQFEVVIQDGLKEGHLDGDADRNLSSVLQLYVGDAFEGFYHDWALRERERLRCLYIEGLRAHMSHLSAHGDYAGAISCGNQILNQDPLQEFVHRELIRLHLERGNRGLANRQFEACEEVLKAELGLRPESETLAARQSIRHSPSQTHFDELVKLKEVLVDMRRLLDVAERRIDILLGSERPDLQSRNSLSLT